MKKKFLFRALLFSSLTQLIFSQISFAEDKKYIAGNIILNGNSHIPNESVLYYLGLSTGGEYSQTEINQMVQKAYNTGYFKKISISHSDFKNIIMIDVIEQPVISSVKFYGNKKINDKDIEKFIKTKSGLTLSDTRLKRDSELILKMYQQKGFFSAVVNPKIIEEEGGGVTVAFEIKEGKKSVIGKILFTGDNTFSSTELKQSILSSEWVFYKFLSHTNTYDPDRFQVDAELITEYYQSRGYPYAKVVNTISELDAKSETFLVTFEIDAGKQYEFGNITLKDELKISDNKEILNSLQFIKNGQIFDINSIRKIISEINNILARKGYAFASIEHELIENNNKIDVKIIINTTNKFFVNNINIVGNSRTKDDVIRREMRISEHDTYDIARIERSIQRIKNLGYFDVVNFTPTQLKNSDKVDLEIDVKEKRTTTALFNVGYNTVIGPFLGVRYSEINLLGTGRDVSTNFQLAKLETAVDVSINEPYFMGYDVNAGVSVFYDKKRYQSSSSKNKYHVTSRGLGLSASYNLSEYLKHNVQYGLKFEEIHHNPNIIISDFLRSDTKTHTVSSVGHSFVYDQTDNIIVPTKGYIIQFGQNFAGLGGDSKYMQNTLSTAHYTPIYKDKIVMKIAGRGGTITGIGKKVRPLDNFYSEDSMIRGFAYNGIGPRDMQTLESLGGKTFFVATAELKFPLGLPKEVGMNGIAFTDCATLYDIDVPNGITNKYFNSKTLRASYGVGVIWESPIGLIRFEYGIPISKSKLDQVDRFNFSIGRSF